MDKSIFWQLIDSSRRASEGDPEAQIEVLRSKLESLSQMKMSSLTESSMSITTAHIRGGYEQLPSLSEVVVLMMASQISEAGSYPVVKRCMRRH